MKICILCSKEFNPADDFLEPAEDLITLIKLDDRVENMCGNCCEVLLSKVRAVYTNLFNNLTPQEQMLLRAKPAKILGDINED